MTNYPQRQGYASQAGYHASPTNRLGVASLALGIPGLVCSFILIFNILSWPMVILGIIFGGVGIDKANKTPGMHKGMAVAGLTCSLVGLTVCSVWMIVTAL